MKQGQYFESIKAASLADIRKALQNDGECIIGDMEITLDNMDNCEVVKGGELLFSCSAWWELEDYLVEESAKA